MKNEIAFEAAVANDLCPCLLSRSSHHLIFRFSSQFASYLFRTLTNATTLHLRFRRRLVVHNLLL